MIDVIDFHSHILPNADHGSSSAEESLRQLELASLNGVHRIVATPHFYPHRHYIEDFLKRRNEAWERLNSLRGQGMPSVAIGAEVLICDEIEKMHGLEELCIRGTDILLLELPFSVFKHEYRNSVIRLIKNGFTVVLAHADRYDADNINLLVECGAKIQLNADALSGTFLNRHIKEWLSRGDVVALGSDIHSTDKKAYKNFARACNKLGRNGFLEQIKQASDSFNINFL